jgi:uncharacterized protein (DUF3084 family)
MSGRLTSGLREVMGSVFPMLQQFSQSRATQLVIMRVIVAGVIAVIWAFEVAQAFGFGAWGAIVTGFVVGILTWLAHSIYVTSVVRQRGFRRALRDARLVIVVAVVIGAILSFATTMQLFRERVLSEWLHSPAVKEVLDPIDIDIKNRKENVTKLDEHRKSLEGENIDEHSNVAPLLADYRRIKDEYDKANEDYWCALDIRCVTRGNNRGVPLDELGGRRNALQLSLDLAKRKLDDAERETKTRTTNEIADHRKKIDKEENQIKQLEDRQQGLVNNRFESFSSFLFRSGEGWAWFIGLLIIYAVVVAIPALFSKDDLQNYYDGRRLTSTVESDFNNKNENHGPNDCLGMQKT